MDGRLLRWAEPPSAKYSMPDVLVACDGSRACQCQGNHQEDGDFFRPGERQLVK